MSKRLGGWTRLWIVVSVIWLVAVVVDTYWDLWQPSRYFILYYQASDEKGDPVGPRIDYHGPRVRRILHRWLPPTVAALGLGLGTRWVWRGFRPKEPQ